MSILDMNVEDVPDLEVMAADEYQVKIIKGEVKDYKNEKGEGKYLLLALEVVDEPLAKTVFHNLFFPKADDDERQVDGARRGFKTFYQAFALPLSGNLDLEELSGKTGWAYLKIKPAKDEFEEANTIGKFIVSN